MTGVGKSHAAASIMALGLDPRFDFSKAYWILAGIAGSIPNALRSAPPPGRVTSWTVDLAYEIDGREIPADWSTGIVPYDRSRPFEQPAPPAASDNGLLAHDLNDGLATWAFALTRGVSSRKMRSSRRRAPAMLTCPMRSGRPSC